MRNKKSVLMTLKVNYGYFSGVGGIAGNVEALAKAGNSSTTAEPSTKFNSATMVEGRTSALLLPMQCYRQPNF